ncbi:bacteriohemerythrin [Magnetospirillum gryphiswaldense]|uniref:Hemerythrin family protein n=1 Tax=Magnetospirillum gryphiswaldense TaxID=55518 RepID=A4U0V5_9PROT|nr:hemerythrin family protein [Magnetospirillum gryphiswaldense]CAM76512.1 hemerythrin family protein [Magnetospirillum gryphiswaldense MSR-1]
MIKLTPDLLIGNTTIDKDHEKLITIINDFLEHSKSLNNAKLMSDTLKALLDYTKFHFEREERIQKECMYPYHDMHLHEHNALVMQIQDMARTYFIEKSKPLDQHSVNILNQFLKTWLIDHIKKFDTNMRQWVDPDWQPPQA